MGADWLKVEKHTPEKPEMFALADLLDIDPENAFAKCFKFWRWADSHAANGNAPGVTKSAIDTLVGYRGFADAMIQVGWLSIADGVLSIPRFGSHMSQSAKNRALTARRVAEHKEKGNAKGNDGCVSDALPDERETRGRSKRNQTLGKTDGGSTVDQPPSQSARSSKDVRDEIDQRPKADLSDLDWSQAVALAENVASKIPPLDDRDRRAWLRFGALACTACSEAWLCGTADSVARSANVKKTRQAMLVAALKTKANELFGYQEPQFQAMVRSIEIPTDVWKSPVLEVRK